MAFHSLSKKILAVKPSQTIALNNKAQQMAKSGIEVLNFTVGEPDFPTPQAIVSQAIKALEQGKTKYGPSGGSLEFRQALCEKLAKENGLTFDPEDIVAGIGAKELLFHIFLSILNDQDEVLIPAPFWVSYEAQVVAAGGRPIIIPMDDDQPAPSPERIHSFSSERTKAIVLTSPHNPGGFVFSERYLKDLSDYLADKPWWVITDEIYEYMSFDKPHLSIGKVNRDLKDRHIVVNGLSKSFAMTGWRVGYSAGPAKVMKLVKCLQSHSSTCLPPFIEQASIFAIKEGKKLILSEVDLLRQRRDLACKLLSELLPDIDFLPPEGAFFLFLDLRAVLEQSKLFNSQNAIAFCDYLLEKHYVALVPGEAFGVPGYVRISYAASEKDLEQGLKKLQKAIEFIR